MGCDGGGGDGFQLQSMAMASVSTVAVNRQAKVAVGKQLGIDGMIGGVTMMLGGTWEQSRQHSEEARLFFDKHHHHHHCIRICPGWLGMEVATTL